MPRHKITLEEYGEKYVAGSASSVGDPDVPVAEDDGARKYRVPKNIAWFDRCAFKCRGCDSVVFSHNSMDPHAKKCPSLAQIGGKTRDKFVIVERVIHDCRDETQQNTPFSFIKIKSKSSLEQSFVIDT